VKDLIQKILNILRIRSTYFNTALSSNWAKKEGNIFILKKPKYIYVGPFPIDEIVINNFGELLVAADEMQFNEVVDYIHDSVIMLDHKLFGNNLINSFNLLNFLSKYQEDYKILYKYFRKMICNRPQKFLYNSDSFSGLENDALLSLIQSDDFMMEEIEIWDNLLKWAITKNPTISNDTSTWKSKEIEIIKESIQHFIPHVRFFQISSDNYYDKVHSLSALLPVKLEKDINLRFIDPEIPISSKILPPRMFLDSKIILMEHIHQIVDWIEPLKIVPYGFKLLLRGSRDGFGVKYFRERCCNKGTTIVLIRLKGNDKIIGGYNPLSWKSIDRYFSTNDSFIFSFQSILNPLTTILSRVKNEKKAIHNFYHGFGNDLQIFRNFYYFRDYERRIIEDYRFESEDYEVFQVIKRT
jgi:hypothetical protein